MAPRTVRSYVAVALVALASCGGDPRAYEYVTDEPRPIDVTGWYELIPSQSVFPDDVKATRDASKPYELYLRPDGTFTATNVPEFAFLQTERLVSVSGRWKLDTVATLGSVSGKGRGIWGISFESSPQVESPQFMGPFGRDHPAERLAFVFGDPDSGEGMMFGRKR
jgi:hypothetical protein